MGPRTGVDGTSKIDKNSTFSHHDMIYINGKLKAYALRICNCFKLEGHFKVI